MHQRTKKQLIAGLLLVSCIFSAWLLFITPEQDIHPLKSLGQADSLLHLTLSDFNLSSSQISLHSTKIDSNFSRINYTISIPPDFSKTQFHAVLKNRLSPYEISLPARIIFPKKNMHIYFNYENTIIRTIKLVTDKDLSMQHSPGSIIVAFSGRPPDDLLEMVTSLGEPIPVAIIVHPSYRLPDWWDEVDKQYSPLFIWPKTAADDNLLGGEQMSRISVIKNMDEELNESVLLSFYDDAEQLSPWHQKTAFSFVDTHNAIIMNEGMGKSTFRQTFRGFVQQARSGKRPVAIITATQKTLKWTKNELNIFKKGGLSITAPPKISF